MDLVLILLLVVLAFILCLTFIPVNINFGLEKHKSLSKRDVSIVWGAVGTTYTDWDKISETQYLLFNQTIVRRRKEKKPKEGPRIETGDILKLIRLPSKALPHFTRFAKTIIKLIVIGRIQCDARIGLSNPAYTGFFFGYFTALTSLLQPTERFIVHLTPVFDKQILEGRLNITIKIKYPIRIIAAGIGLLLRKPVRESLKVMRELR